MRPRWRVWDGRVRVRFRQSSAVAVSTALLLCIAPAAQALPPMRGPAIQIEYVEKQVERPPTTNNEDPVPGDLGRVGAELGLKDSNATGRFVGLAFTLKTTIVPPDGDLEAVFRTLLDQDKPQFVVVDAPADDVLALADMPGAKDTVFLNIGSPDSRLRDQDCRSHVLHVLPSRAMLTDALMQFLVFKRWTRMLLVSGPNPDDKLYAQSLRDSAHKFGVKIVKEAAYDAHGADIRDSALKEFALVTRGPDQDVVAVADESNLFGPQLVYNTDLPRPVVGTQGLMPQGWGRAVEAWAAVQLQSRFRKLADRAMQPVDYAGWFAVHAVGEAGVQLKSADPAAIAKLMLDPKFEIGGFKGRQLSFRAWDRQLRQPIFLLWPGAVVAAAPLEGFLHQTTDLDSLGIDKPESVCKAMGN